MELSAAGVLDEVTFEVVGPVSDRVEVEKRIRAAAEENAVSIRSLDRRRRAISVRFVVTALGSAAQVDGMRRSLSGIYPDRVDTVLAGAIRVLFG
jgi:hypothetical protein